jgi:hypothetical protein
MGGRRSATAGHDRVAAIVRLSSGAWLFIDFYGNVQFNGTNGLKLKQLRIRKYITHVFLCLLLRLIYSIVYWRALLRVREQQE